MKWHLTVLTANNNDEKKLWEQKIRLVKSDIFHSADYMHPFEQFSQATTSSNFGGTAYCFVFGDEDNFILYPMFKRDLSKLPFYNQIAEEQPPFFDIASPYGYAGPVAHIEGKNLEKDLWEAFLKELHDFCLRNNIISEFARLNPYLRNHEPLLKFCDGTIRKAGSVFYVDLTASEEIIWSNMKKANRNSITRAIRENVVIHRTKSRENLDIFIRIYNETMNRRNAEDSYYFSNDFYYSLFDSLKEKINLFIATHNEEVVSAALFIGQGDFIHYFLSGTKMEKKSLGATNLLLHEAIKWAKKEAYKVFDLGGGYRPGDSLYSFKESFCKQAIDFYVYSKIHDEKQYTFLCDAKDKYDKQTTRMQSEYFPYYRR